MRITNGVLSFIQRLLSLIIALGTALWVKWCQKMLTHIFYNSLESVLAVIHKKWALWNFCIWMKITMLLREHYRKWWFSGVVARKKKKHTYFYSFSHFIPSNNLSHSVNFPLNYWSKKYNCSCLLLGDSQNFWMLNSRFKNTSGLQLEILNLRNRNRTLSQVCSKNNEERGDNCCMESLRVDFHEDYGWIFVISPKDFEANYCSGSYFGYLRTYMLFDKLYKVWHIHWTNLIFDIL